MLHYTHPYSALDFISVWTVKNCILISKVNEVLVFVISQTVAKFSIDTFYYLYHEGRTGIWHIFLGEWGFLKLDHLYYSPLKRHNIKVPEDTIPCHLHGLQYMSLYHVIPFTGGSLRAISFEIQRGTEIKMLGKGVSKKNQRVVCPSRGHLCNSERGGSVKKCRK